MLQEFRRFDDNRNCKILGSAILQPVSLAPEIGDTVLERRNRCLLIHEKHHYSLLPIRIYRWAIRLLVLCSYTHFSRVCLAPLRSALFGVLGLCVSSFSNSCLRTWKSCKSVSLRLAS